MSATKIGENTTNISKRLIFTIHLHFITSNQTSAYKKLNLPLFEFFFVLALEMHKRLKQSRVCHAFPYKKRPTNL